MTEQEARHAWEQADQRYDAQDFAAAIPLYQEALSFFAEQAHPSEWASLQNSLGNSLAQLPTGDREENLQQAIGCYQAALRVYTEERFPAQWAMTQNNLGNAYSDLPTGDRGENLQKAIGCFQAALRVYTEKKFPADWAMTQNNLGIAYSNLPPGDRGENLQPAIGCYQAALRVYTEKKFPAQWAMTQNNLGNTYSDLPTGDRGENLQQAIGCYQAALRVYTEKKSPAQWAMTQNNLGNAYSNLPTGDRGENLQQAIGRYQAALRVYTEKKSPADWAMTQNNLAAALVDAGKAHDAWEVTHAAVQSKQWLAMPEWQILRSLWQLAELAQSAGCVAETITTLRAAAARREGDRMAAARSYARRLLRRLAGGEEREPPASPDFPRDAYDTDARLKQLAECVARAQERKRELGERLAAKRTLRASDDGRFWVLRQWSSYTPLLGARGRTENRGGGYFLEWRGNGVAIDPGLDFLRNLRDERLSVLDIDVVVLTHNHIDHVGDVWSLLTLLHECHESDGQADPHPLHLVCSPSTYGMFADIAVHAPWITPMIPLRPGETQEIAKLPLRIAGFERQHTELGGRRGAMGLRIELLNSNSQVAAAIGLPGDGGWQPDLGANCEGTDLLLLNLGSIYPEDLEAASPHANHLGVMGVFGVLSHLDAQGKAPRLTLISELGEELARDEGFVAEACCDGLGLEYRTHVVETRLRRVVALPAVRIVCEWQLREREASRCTNPADLRTLPLRSGEIRYEYLCDIHHRIATQAS